MTRTWYVHPYTCTAVQYQEPGEDSMVQKLRPEIEVTQRRVERMFGRFGDRTLKQVQDALTIILSRRAASGVQAGPRPARAGRDGQASRAVSERVRRKGSGASGRASRT